MSSLWCKKIKMGWGKKILLGVGGFFLFLIVVGMFAGGDKSKSSLPTETKKQEVKQTTTSQQSTPAPKKEEYTWNTKEIDAAKNGNMPIAIKKMKVDGDINSIAITGSPADVAKRPWDFYGKAIKFTGAVGVVQDYPPGNDLSKAMGGSCAEIVIEAADGTIVDAFVSGSSGSLKVGQNTTVYGYPTGITEVANKV